jgi:molybdenum cofactor cytidylyltransferase
MPRAVAVVPAAGRSERFGGMKLLADVAGEPLLNRTLRCLLEASVDTVIVAVAPQAALDAVDLLHDPRVRTVVNPDPSRGMFSSIQTGLAACDGDPILVLPADMPFVGSATVAAVIDACRRGRSPVVATYQGTRGHPIALPRGLRGALLRADPDRSLKEALAELQVTLREIDVDDPGVIRDVDTREDLRN